MLNILKLGHLTFTSERLKLLFGVATLHMWLRRLSRRYNHQKVDGLIPWLRHTELQVAVDGCFNRFVQAAEHRNIVRCFG